MNTRRSFLQTLTALAASFALPWKAKVEKPDTEDDGWVCEPIDYSTYHKFTGAVSNEWFDVRNWEGGVVAKSGDRVIIACYPVGCVELPDGYTLASVAILSGSLTYNVKCI